MSTILVTGASGFVGSHAVPAPPRGRAIGVVALVRTPEAGRARPGSPAGAGPADVETRGSAT